MDTKGDFVIDEIHLDHVSFKYSGSFNRTILKDINFTITRNKTTAIVGTSGSGKASLLKLLLQYYPANDGRILVGKKDRTELSPDSWRQQCGVEPGLTDQWRAKTPYIDSACTL